MLEVEGKILNTLVSILINSRASLSYIVPRVVEKCKLVKAKQKNACLVQLATRVKRKVTESVKHCRLSFDEMDTSVNLNIIPFRSYDILIGMEWLEYHNMFIICLHKSFDCVDEEGI